MIKFRVNSKPARVELEGRIKKAQQSHILMKKISAMLEMAVDKNFEQEGRPRWKALKESTLEAREAQGHTGKILQVRGRLKNSIISRYSHLKAIIGTNYRTARIHQYGGFTGVKGKTKIPARPFIKLTEKDEELINKRIREYFK